MQKMKMMQPQNAEKRRAIMQSSRRWKKRGEKELAMKYRDRVSGIF